MEMSNLQDLLIENLKDLYSAENQILKALPKAAKKVESDQLRQALEMHVRQTEGHIKRLEQVLGKMGEKPGGKKCHGMQGLLEEAKELMGEDVEPDVLDAGLIVDCQKVEHYEIAGYGSAVTFAKLLGDDEAARLLAQTLEEEKATDQKLTQIAESSINVQAENQEADSPATGRMGRQAMGRQAMARQAMGRKSSGGRGKGRASTSSRRR